MNDQTYHVTEEHSGELRIFWHVLTVSFLLLLALLVAACSSPKGTSTPNSAREDAAEHAELEEHAHTEESEEHEHTGNEAHAVPEEAASVPNPVAATENSIASGAALFSTNCVACHGETGTGNGPSAAGLDPQPANLQEHHVQDLSDGALFYIISSGVEGTAMVAWKETLSDEEIWHLVNFLRTLHHE